ncbi:hypothetical protein ACS0TY_021087 [Phlomoides rotata]
MCTVDRKNAMNMLLPNTVVVVSIGILILTIKKRRRRMGVHRRTFTILDRIPAQMKNMSYLCEVSDEDCRDKLRMDRATFHKLCFILQSVWVKFAFKWSGQTVSKHFHAAVNSVLMLHVMFLVRPQPINEDNKDPRWHQFKGYLGALDGTHIDVHVPISEKERYRNRKGQISVNVLGVCDINMRFMYILSGWEGSVVDSRVLQNALNMENGLEVPRVCYMNLLIGYIFFVIGGMDHFGNQTGQDADRVKFARGRRSMSKIKEDALIMCLTNVVLEGWKSKNCFKAGFQRELEKGMRKIIPGTDIVVNPHINSKIHVWKKEYGTLSDLLSKSGIGWNSTTSILEVEDEGADPHVKGLRYKTWPYYPQWIEIFGKDRAIGENVFDPIDLINELYRTGLDQEGDTGDKYVSLTPDCMHDMEDDVTIKPIDLTPKAVSKGKKRKTNDSDITMLIDSLG